MKFRLIHNSRSIRLMVFSVFASAAAFASAVDYGADISYTIHHSSVQPSDIFGTSRKLSYEALLQSCRDHGGAQICDMNEEDRLQQNLLQPQSMKVCGDAVSEVLVVSIQCPPITFYLHPFLFIFTSVIYNIFFVLCFKLLHHLFHA